MTPTQREQAQTRIRDEAATIEAAGSLPAFARVGDIVSAIRERGVVLGPATGLAMQSLCAYLTGITSYDPYRVDHDYAPMLAVPSTQALEIEIQIAPAAREAAVRAITEVVGAERVAYVPAIERITAARAIRMVSAVAPVPERDLTTIRRAVARNPGASIQHIVEADRFLAGTYRRSNAVRELLNRATLLEDLPSGFIRSRRSLAVAGGERLTDVLAHSTDDERGDIFIHASRDALPIAPVMKIDLTPIGAMQIVSDVERHLRVHRGIEYGWEYLAIHDLGVWDDIRGGDSEGVFLFEGQALRDLRTRFPLHSSDDLTNFLAILRSPAGHESAAERLQAFAEAEVPEEEQHGPAADVLAATRGQFLYDEQIRDLLCALTGMEVGKAAALLSGLKQTVPAALARVRRFFMTAAADQDVPMESAQQWFDVLLHQAKHTIRRERVLADALLVCKLFMLKRYYPAVFYAALLNAYWHSDGRAHRYLAQVERLGLLVRSDINDSDIAFVEERGRVRAGLCVVQGLEPALMERIVESRAGRPFVSLEDFVRRVGAKALSAVVARRLIDEGLFDGLGIPRPDLTKRAKALLRRPRKGERAAEEGQLDLPFDM